MHCRNSHSPLVDVCGGISWAASSLVVTLVGPAPAGLIGEEMTNFNGTFYLTKWRHYTTGVLQYLPELFYCVLITRINFKGCF